MRWKPFSYKPVVSVFLEIGLLRWFLSRMSSAATKNSAESIVSTTPKDVVSVPQIIQSSKVVDFFKKLLKSCLSE